MLFSSSQTHTTVFRSIAQTQGVWKRNGACGAHTLYLLTKPGMIQTRKQMTNNSFVALYRNLKNQATTTTKKRPELTKYRRRWCLKIMFLRKDQKWANFPISRRRKPSVILTETHFTLLVFASLQEHFLTARGHIAIGLLSISLPSTCFCSDLPLTSVITCLYTKMWAMTCSWLECILSLLQ